MSTPSNSSPQAGSQAHFTSHQMKLGTLLNSWFLGLLVGGARLVSDQVLLFKEKERTLTQVSPNVRFGEVV